MQHYQSRLRRTASRRKLPFFSGKTAFLEAKLAKYVFFGLIGLIIIGIVYVLWVSRDLPTPGRLANGDIKDSTRILDRNGKLLYSFYKDYNRIYVSLDQIPKNVKDATIATEDKDFYHNKGFSPFAYLRVLKDIVLYHRVTGGSTITQQLVKNVLLSPERTTSRKLKELILAIQVDARYSKDQILEMYLNNIPYGGTAIGIEAGSDLYFNKKAKDLTLAQSAFLAGLPQSPSYYSPYINKDKTYIGRSKDVLTRMREDGYISQKQADAALNEIKNFTFKERKTESIKGPHFVMWVRQQLVDMFGENVVSNGNLTVKTTLDADIEQDAENIVDKEFEGFKNYKVKNAAVMVLDVKTGGILAMLGSRDYFNTDIDGNFNAATALRQPGSSLKPIMYSVAFEKGYTPATLVMDVKTDFPINDGTGNNNMYTPVNYDGKFRGPVQLRFALGNSLNVPAVKMLARVGIKPVMQKGFDMGISNWEPTQEHLQNVGLSLVLGGREASLMQITSAYSVFARQGQKKESYGIEEVDDTHGKVLYKHQDKGSQQVLEPEVSFLISHILLDNNARAEAFGTSSWLVVPGRTVSVKTGTTDQKRDNWTIGYTPSYSVGVWVGNNDNSPLDPRIASGITGASPIWNKVMSRVLKGTPKEEFQVPGNVAAKQVDAFSGGLPIDGQPTRVEYFIKGTEPSTKSPIYMTLKMSKHDGGKLASDEEIAKGDYDTRDVINFIEEDPVSTDGKNRWQDAIDAWVNEHYKDDQKYKRITDKSGYHYDSSSPTDTPTPIPTGVPTATPTP